MPRAPTLEGPFPWRKFVPQVTHGTRMLLREQALGLHFVEAAAGAVVIVTTVWRTCTTCSDAATRHSRW